MYIYKSINVLRVYLYFNKKTLVKVIFWRPCRCPKRQLIGHRREYDSYENGQKPSKFLHKKAIMEWDRKHIKRGEYETHASLQY
jgi:hypothetical protein